MKFVLKIFLVLVSFRTAAQREIKVDEAIHHVGDTVKICGIVYGSRYMPAAKGSPTFLDVGKVYPKPTLMVIISKEARERFKQPPENLYNKLEICVTGKIRLHRRTPEIVVSEPGQIYVNQ